MLHTDDRQLPAGPSSRCGGRSHASSCRGIPAMVKRVERRGASRHGGVAVARWGRRGTRLASLSVEVCSSLVLCGLCRVLCAQFARQVGPVLPGLACGAARLGMNCM